MPGEFREPRRLTKKVPEDIIKILGKESQEASKVLEKTVSSLKNYTLDIENNQPELKETLDELNSYTEKHGLKILVNPREKILKPGEKAEIRSDISALFPANFLLFSAENLINYSDLKKSAPDFAEKGLKSVIEWQKELFEGKAFEILKDIFKKNNELHKARRKAYDTVKDLLEPSENRLKEISGEVLEKTLVKLIKSGRMPALVKIDKELEALERSLRVQAGKQFIKKNEKSADSLAAAEAFLDLLQLRTEKGLAVDEKRIRNNLSNDFPDLDEEMMEQIIKKVKKEKETIKKIKWEKDNESFYA